MSGIEQVKAKALVQGWTLLHENPAGFAVFKWLPGVVRHEVHVIADAAGRVEAVSEWENERTNVDQGAGVRKRAEALLSDALPDEQAAARRRWTSR